MPSPPREPRAERWRVTELRPQRWPGQAGGGSYWRRDGSWWRRVRGSLGSRRVGENGGGECRAGGAVLRREVDQQ